MRNIFAVGAILGASLFAACGSDSNDGAGGGKGGSGNSGGGGGAADASIGTGATGTGAVGTGAATGNDAWYQTDGGCNISGCTGHIYECGDCIDNDGDGLIDSQDSD